MSPKPTVVAFRWPAECNHGVGTVVTLCLIVGVPAGDDETLLTAFPPEDLPTHRMPFERCRRSTLERCRRSTVPKPAYNWTLVEPEGQES